MTTKYSQDALDKLSKLKGEKVTLFGLSDWGFPYLSHTTITDVFLRNYAQFDNMLHIQHKPKNKRHEFIKRVHDYDKLLVYKGHIQLESNMYVTQKEKSDVTIKESLVGFSDDYYTRALNSTTEEPFLIINEDKN